MDERRTPCSSPAKLRSGLPPSVQMPTMVKSVESKICQCQACKQRKTAKTECYKNAPLSLSTLHVSNKESNLTKLEKGFDDFVKRNLQPTSGQACCSKYCKKTQGPSNRFNMPQMNLNKSHLMQIKNKLMPQNLSQLGLTAGYDRWSNVFNNGVVHFFSEIIFIFVIVLVAAMAVWIAFFQFMYKIATALHQTRNRHVKSLVIALVAILLFSVVSNVVRERCKVIQVKRAKMHKKSYGSLLPSWKHKMPPTSHWVSLPSFKHKVPATSHWISLPSWSLTQKPCSRNKFYSFLGGSGKAPKKSYIFWQSSCAHKKKSKFQSYFIFSRPPPPKTLRERMTNVIFYWQKAKPPQRSWLGIMVFHNEPKKHHKSYSWSSMLHFGKKPEKKGWFLQVRTDFHIYWTGFLQRNKYIWRKFQSKLQEANKKRKWQKSCGCRSSYYFWRKPCSAHKMKGRF